MMAKSIEDILLEPEQQQLLVLLVEAARNASLDERESFLLSEDNDGYYLVHPKVNSNKRVHKPDLDILVGERLLLQSTFGNRVPAYDITPLGFKYYEELKSQIGQPYKRVESAIRGYLFDESFQQKYAAAYGKWAEAETLLWSVSVEDKLTTIGHLCREAIQEFATTLVERFKLVKVDQDKAHAIARISAVINYQKNGIGANIVPLLDALLVYTGTLSDLIQRQEHGGQKEGSTLIWEDGRRVVFQLANVMIEVDRSISTASKKA